MKRLCCSLILLLIHIHCVLAGLAGNFRESVFQKRPCEPYEFPCLDGVCIERGLMCNGEKECRDGSDESYCSIDGNKDCPESSSFYRCQNPYNGYGNLYYRCIPNTWRCDNIQDCMRNADDEKYCTMNTTVPRKGLENIPVYKQAAINWLQHLSSNSSTERWGVEVHRIAVALHLANAEVSDSGKSELAYEVSLQLLSRMTVKKMKNISSSTLAQFVNAFLVTCINPRKFHGVDLVAELRKRVNAQNYTSPFVLLTLCNAGEKISGKDAQKLVTIFWNKRTEFWTDTQAYVIMALACAASQPNANYDISEISALTMELKSSQFRNGSVDNLKTTALVMQALFASEEKNDEENFDEEKALKQILSQQLVDGSFGGVINTYFALPVLNYKSLNNISSSHCPKVDVDESNGLRNLQNQVDPKWYIQYSLWIGNQKNLQRSLKLHVPANTSLYTLMEIASEVDSRYKFLINMKNGKPYIYQLSGIQNDPELEIFWFPYIIVEENGTSKEDPINKSPADVIPNNNEHIVFWYKTSSWNEN